MNIVITGGHGFLGAQLARTLAANGTIRRPDGNLAQIDEIYLVDIRERSEFEVNDERISSIVGDIADPETISSLFDLDFGLVFHLASLVSGGAESNFEQGLRANLMGTQLLLEECRQRARSPTLVFTSSIAAYGGDIPDTVTDATALTPQTSYGAHKVICELLIHDYARKGYINGRSIRLPIIIIRPGIPNSAASSFASSIFREPLTNKTCYCGVAPDDEIYVASTRDAVDSMILAAESPDQSWGSFRGVTVPGMTTSPRKMVQALREFAGRSVADLVQWTADPFIQDIVRSWPSKFSSRRALRLGFREPSTLQMVIQDFVREFSTNLQPQQRNTPIFAKRRSNAGGAKSNE